MIGQTNGQTNRDYNFIHIQNIDLGSLDIAVNAVATAVKDFFFKRLPPLLPTEHMTDLESIASMQVTTK